MSPTSLLLGCPLNDPNHMPVCYYVYFNPNASQMNRSRQPLLRCPVRGSPFASSVSTLALPIQTPLSPIDTSSATTVPQCTIISQGRGTTVHSGTLRRRYLFTTFPTTPFCTGKSNLDLCIIMLLPPLPSVVAFNIIMCKIIFPVFL